MQSYITGSAENMRSGDALWRRNAILKVPTRIFYPPSFLLLDESLAWLALAGLVVTAAGVAMVMRSANK